ncbi:hypothetical protein [Rodentibacter genomosp. 1]|nr:hypothetical protein [Rodentibacter genomosp. 1]
MNKENNGWISVEDRLPQKTKEDSFYDSDDVLCYGKEDPDDENHIFYFSSHGW